MDRVENIIENELINELKDENNELQKKLDILKKKISEGIKLTAKDMEFNEPKTSIK